MKVFVLGHRGMLGHVVTRYLSGQGLEVLTSEVRYTAGPRDPLIEAVRDSDAEWVINALGRIKQKGEAAEEFFRANTLFPLQLKARLRKPQRLIHASTDCVFSGRRGSYRVDDERDGDDLYGLSKLLGEAVAELERCQVIRVSIIGPERASALGLMGWFLKQSGKVPGYVNHHWNGITTLEWAKICGELLRGDPLPASPVLQPGTWPPCSKCELLQMIGKCWAHPVSVQPVTAPSQVDRTLVPNLARPALEVQLTELKSWYDAQRFSGTGTS